MRMLQPTANVPQVDLVALFVLGHVQSYSRWLSETANEMEVQTLSGVGRREVSELLELLQDAQIRLPEASCGCVN